MPPADALDLSDAYRNAADIPGGDLVPGRWAAQAAAFRAGRAAAAAAPAEALGEGGELWRPPTPPGTPPRTPPGPARGLLVLLHGGYWMALSPASFSHMAAGALARGWAVALPGYPLAPRARLAEITRAAARGIDEAAGRVAGPVVVSGHSAGGHLAARMGCGDVALACRGRLARIVPVSPLANLLPLLRTDLNATLGMDAAEALAESPMLRPRPAAPVTVWVGGAERPAFREQALWLARAWEAPLVVEPARHHFDVIEGWRGGALLDACLA